MERDRNILPRSAKRVELTDELKVRINQTSEWFLNENGANRDPKSKLDNPSGLISEFNSTEERKRLVDTVFSKRLEKLPELSSLSLEDILKRGSLITYNADETISDGAAESATRGFLNMDGEPGWSTWVDYLDPSGGDNPVLIAWMPESQFIGVKDAIKNDPIDYLEFLNPINL